MYDIMDFECKGLKIEHVKDENYIVTVDVIDVNNDYIQLDFFLKGDRSFLSDGGQIVSLLQEAKKLYGDPYKVYEKVFEEINRHLTFYVPESSFRWGVIPNDFAKKARIMALTIARISDEFSIEPDQAG